MKDWPAKSLEEICEVFGGSTPSRGNPTYWDGEIPWVTPTDLPMSEEGISVVSESRDLITRAGLDGCAATLLPPGTVLFSSRATIGKVGVAAVPLATNQGFVNFVPKDKVNSRFLAYALWTSRKDITRLAASTTFKEVSRGTLRKYRLPVPSLSEQERLVKLLDEADELRKLRAQANMRTDALIPALFNEMFGDPQTYLRAWPLQPLHQIVDFIGGGTPSRDAPEFWRGHTPWVSPKDMKPDEITGAEEHIGEAAFAATNLRLLPADTVLIVVRGMILAHTVPIRVCRVPVAINQDMKALLPKHPICPEYLRWALQAHHGNLLQRVSTAGHGTKKLDTDRLRELPLAEPPMSVQIEFSRRVAEIRALRADEAISRNRLYDLFQSLLHRAFAGEL